MILIISSILSVLLLSSPGIVNVASGQGRITNVKVLEGGDDWQCPSMEERERARNEIQQDIDLVIATTVLTITGLTTSMPFTTTSATTAPTTASTTTMPSTTASATTLPPRICTCTGSYTCNGTPGWRCVAFINMTDTSYNCPTGLNLTSYSKRTCGKSHTTIGGCSSTTFSVGSLPYSRVCGRIRGYQFGVTGAFVISFIQGINSNYVGGVSLTHGGAGNRQHIWTFAAGLSEVTSMWPSHGCPCDTAPPSVVPTFVGNDYFCESGSNSE